MIVIDRRFRGPPESGQGGYTCGLLARELQGAAEVSLRLPPPLERPLALGHDVGDRVMLLDGDAIIAEARQVTLELDPPAPAGLGEAEAAVAGYAGFAGHAFPTCFACGPDRLEGDGLRLFPGLVAGREVIACPWRPVSALADDEGIVRPEFVWAALDCPTAFACTLDGPPIVLARLTGRIDHGVRAGEPHVVTAWRIGRDGRKHHAGCVISTPEGQALAISQALWIEPKDPNVFGAASSRLAGGESAPGGLGPSSEGAHLSSCVS